jgi:hypothetical protein
VGAGLAIGIGAAVSSGTGEVVRSVVDVGTGGGVWDSVGVGVDVSSGLGVGVGVSSGLGVGVDGGVGVVVGLAAVALRPSACAATAGQPDPGTDRSSATPSSVAVNERR